MRACMHHVGRVEIRPSTPMSYEHICMMLKRFKFIHSMQTHGLHVSHHMGKISACQQRLEMTCISLHKEGECTKQERRTMENEKGKNPSNQYMLEDPSLKLAIKTCVARQGERDVWQRTYSCLAPFSKSAMRACMHDVGRVETRIFHTHIV